MNKCMWVIVAAMHMEDKAKHWLHVYQMQHELGSWDQFMDVVQEKFGKHGNCQVKMELSELSQTEEVKEGTPPQVDQITSETQGDVADVVCDEEVQDMLDQHGLLKQLALGGDCFVGEERKPTGAPNIDYLFAYVDGPSALLDSVHDALDELSLEDRVTADPKQVLITASLVWDALEGLDLPCADAVCDEDIQCGQDAHCHVIWDEEIAHELYTFDQNVFPEGAVEHPEVVSMASLWSGDALNSHDLLQQLALGMDKQMSCKQVLDLKASLSTGDTIEVFDETSFTISLSSGREGYQKEMLHEVVWDEEVTQNPGLHGNLSQQLACDMTQASVELESVNKTKVGCMMVVQSNELWSRLHDRLDQLHIRLGSIDTTNQQLAAQLVRESKMLNQSASGYQVLAKQLDNITQDVLRLINFQMSRALDGLEVAAPELNSKGSTLGTYVPWRLELVEPDVLFPVVGDSMPPTVQGLA